MIAAHELKEKAEERQELLAVRDSLGLELVKAVGLEPSGDLRGIRVHFVRHGRGEHNVFAAEYPQEKGNPYVDLQCPIDAVLVEEGRADAKRAGQQLSQRLGDRKAVCLVSPMRRTIQTMMGAREELSKPFIEIVAEESLRERFGVHRCDSLAEYDRSVFGLVDWSRMHPVEEDPAKNGIREPYADLLARGHRLVERLRRVSASHPNSDIVCFSHSSFLFALFNGVLELKEEALVTPFATGEVRSIRLL